MAAHKIRRRDGWSPYFAGALTGVLAVCSALVTKQLAGRAHFFGTASTFERIARSISQHVAGWCPHKAISFAQDKALVDWQFMLVAGVFIGAFISALHDGCFAAGGLPEGWRRRFGPAWYVRASGAFFGGLIAMFGARLAGGCPSGHGLSGMMQLSPGGFVALALYIAVGSLVARLLYRGCYD